MPTNGVSIGRFRLIIAGSGGDGLSDLGEVGGERSWVPVRDLDQYLGEFVVRMVVFLLL